MNTQPTYALFSGYGWSGSLRQAWMVNHELWRHYDYFREPLHGFLLSYLGELFESYPKGGLFIGFTSVVTCICTTGGAAWCLAPRSCAGWVAGFAMIVSTVTIPYVGLWLNGYPLSLAALSLLLFSSTMLTLKKRRWSFYFALLGSCFAMLCDSRFIGWLPIFWTAFLFSGMIKRSKWIGIVLLLPILAPSLGHIVFKSDPAHLLSWKEKRTFQQEVAQRWVQKTEDQRMKSLCEEVSLDLFWTSEFLTTQCSRAVLAHNIYTRLPTRTPISPWLLCVCFLVFFIKRNHRASSLLGLYILPLWVMASFTPIPPRYMIWVTPTIAILPALAIAHLPFARFLFVLATCALIQVKENPSQIRYIEEHGVSSQDSRSLQKIKMSDELIFDCTPKGISLLLLPKAANRILQEGRRSCRLQPKSILLIDPRTPPSFYQNIKGTMLSKTPQFEIWRISQNL
ncbi:MAG: hypothetical protein CMK59_00980 [Proteobacteria bacterium]|nr:hypothetical protein [Pseudomonadota bacterium]